MDLLIPDGSRTPRPGGTLSVSRRPLDSPCVVPHRQSTCGQPDVGPLPRTSHTRYENWGSFVSGDNFRSTASRANDRAHLPVVPEERGRYGREDHNTHRPRGNRVGTRISSGPRVRHQNNELPPTHGPTSDTSRTHRPSSFPPENPLLSSVGRTSEGTPTSRGRPRRTVFRCDPTHGTECGH